MSLVSRHKRLFGTVVMAVAVLGVVFVMFFHGTQRAAADPTPTPTPSGSIASTTPTAGSTPTTQPTRSAGVVAPTAPKAPANPSGGDLPGNSGDISVNVGGKPSTSISIMLLLTVVSVAPSLLLLMTSFTKIFVVLSITRNALGLTTVPPNQVLAGLSLFISIFIMGPVFSKVNSQGISPYLAGTKTREAAFHDGIAPLQTFMLAHTRPEEIALMLRAAQLPNPTNSSSVGLTTLIPAFVLSELRSAMIIGFVIYIPFLIIDMVVSSSLMSLGMMMLPPVTVSLPFKLLLFVLVDGWGLVINSLVSSYRT
jgi:flagellar biosynthetic protein FliP